MGQARLILIVAVFFIPNQKILSTPEELMRSRYTAYNQVNIDYIARTMRSPAAAIKNIKNAAVMPLKLFVN